MMVLQNDVLFIKRATITWHLYKVEWHKLKFTHKETALGATASQLPIG